MLQYLLVQYLCEQKYSTVLVQRYVSVAGFVAHTYTPQSWQRYADFFALTGTFGETELCTIRDNPSAFGFPSLFSLRNHTHRHTPPGRNRGVLVDFRCSTYNYEK